MEINRLIDELTDIPYGMEADELDEKTDELIQRAEKIRYHLLKSEG
jgi:hypothetical protein